MLQKEASMPISRIYDEYMKTGHELKISSHSWIIYGYIKEKAFTMAE